jgi:hypothetical protein
MIQLTIYVDDITTVMSVFTHIRLYTSSEENGSYTHLDYIALVGGQSVYEYTHVAGTSDTWYKSSYWSVSTESSLSDPVQGADAELYHYPTYPTEVSFSTSEQSLIRKIRRLIGDNKAVERMYLDGDEFISALKEDDKTVDIDDRGWPVYITVNDVEKTSYQDPVVQGYKYLTFSGTLDSDSDVVAIWYYSFKFSDREIYQAYSDAMIPPGLTSTSVTQDHLILQSAIDLLQNMYAEDAVDDGAVIRDDMSLYDPTPGLRQRDALIKRLQDMLDILVKQYMFSDVSGVLVD